VNNTWFALFWRRCYYAQKRFFGLIRRLLFFNKFSYHLVTISIFF
jgi:hypothetical protein